MRDRVRDSLLHLLERLLALAEQIVINSYVEICVKQLLIEPFFRRIARAGGGEHVGGLQVALEQVVHLPHRHAPVVADLEHRLAGRADTVLFAMHMNRHTAFSTSLLSKSW